MYNQSIQIGVYTKSKFIPYQKHKSPYIGKKFNYPRMKLEKGGKKLPFLQS